MIIRNIAALLLLSLLAALLLSLLAACTSSPKISDEKVQSSQAQFFKSLNKLCGARFEGAMTYPEEGQDSFAGKLLVASIDSCNSEQIKIPFAVGEDTSRTWIISKTANGLQLKHDHRHADGTPDEINMYGGLALNEGSPYSQSFYADEHTATIIPAAATNVWTLSLSKDARELTYYLERNAAPRFKAVLKRVSP